MVHAVRARQLWNLGLAELFFKPEVDVNTGALHAPKTLLETVASTETGDPDFAHARQHTTTRSSAWPCRPCLLAAGQARIPARQHRPGRHESWTGRRVVRS